MTPAPPVTDSIRDHDQDRCSRCSLPLDTTGAPPWCKSCRAKYQRDYRALRDEMKESRGFAAGISAMRDHLAAAFERLGSGGFNGYEAATLIRQAKGPVDVPAKTPAADA